MNTNPDPLKNIEDLTKEVHTLVEQRGKGAFRRYPLTFALMATFGFVATIYGFEGIVDRVALLRDNPGVILLLGIIILLITGKLYKKLSK